MSEFKLNRTRVLLIILALAVLAGIIIGVRALVTFINYKSDISKIEKRYPDAVITASGLRYIIYEEGSGPKPIAGRKVNVRYIGSLLNGREFDNNYNEQYPLEFEAGIGNAIKGFDEAVMDMRENEKRLVIIPPELGYGKRRAGTIPRNSFLLFEMELLMIK